MLNSSFKFKHFTIKQDKCAMKVGTDGVLLGAWVNARGNNQTLDIGTGTGLVALMIAQKTTGYIHAVELDPVASQQAEENFKSSAWSKRLKCFNRPIQDYVKETSLKYDLIVSNPPYFDEGKRSLDNKRAQARHTDTLTLQKLVELVAFLLSDKGSFCIILPYSKRIDFIRYAAASGFWIKREARIRPLPNENYVRIMFELEKHFPENYSIEEFEIEDTTRHTYSKSFIEYTKDFYLE